MVSQVAGLFLVDHELKGMLLAGFFINWYDGEMDVAGVQVEPTPTGDG